MAVKKTTPATPKRKAPKKTTKRRVYDYGEESSSRVDRWTSNGHGIIPIKSKTPKK